MNELPKLYKNTNINPIDNNKTKCYVKELMDIPINQKVEIKTINNIYNTYIIRKNETIIKTVSDKIIPIKDIIYIKIK